MRSSIDNLAIYFNTSRLDHECMTTFATLIGFGIFVAAVYFFAPADGEGTFIRAEQFRLAAPLGGAFHTRLEAGADKPVGALCDCDEGEEITNLSPVP